MDAQRFGRALGLGTREVAKALYKAADAAAAPNPNAGPAARAQAASAASAPAARPASKPVASRAATPPAAVSSSRVFAAGRQAGKQALAPVSRAAGVLWFEITGVFFGLFALGMGLEAWHRHADLLGGATDDLRFRAWATLLLTLAFAWFTVSSFVRASRRSKH